MYSLSQKQQKENHKTWVQIQCRYEFTLIESSISQRAKDAWSSLASLGELLTPTSTTRHDFLAECRNGRFDGVKAAYRTFGSVSITGRIEGEVVEALANAGLKFLAHNGSYAFAQYLPQLLLAEP